MFVHSKPLHQIRIQAILSGAPLLFGILRFSGNISFHRRCL